MSRLLIVGASDQARVTIDLILSSGKHEIYGILDAGYPQQKVLMGYPILGTENDLKKILSAAPPLEGVIAIGDNWVRSVVRDKLRTSSPIFP